MRTRTKPIGIIKSSLRKAPILEDGTPRGKRRIRRTARRRSTLVSHAETITYTYPPRDEMVQRILRKIAKAKNVHKTDPGSRGEAEQGELHLTTDALARRIGTKSTQQQSPTKVARAKLKHDLLATAAEARDRARNNSVGRIHKVDDHDGRGKGREAKARGQGAGYDRRCLSTSKPLERDAILRLMAF